MSDETTGESALTTEDKSRPLGVLATWRQTSRPTKALLAGVFVNKLGGFLQLFLVLFLTHRGFSAGQAGLALGIYGAGSVIGTFTGGWLSDRLTARSATMISMLGSAVLIVSIIYIRVYLLLLLVVLLVSSIGQLYRPAAQSMITSLTQPGQLVMVTAMYRMCLNLGTTAAPLIGVALVSISYDLLFWVQGVAALVYGLIAMTALPRRAAAGRQAGDAAEAGEAAPQATQARQRGGYLAVLSDWRYSVFLLAFLLLSVVYVQYTAALPLAIVHAGLRIWWYGAIISMNGLVIVTCEVAATRFVQTWPLRLTQMSGFTLLAIGYGMYAIALVPLFLVLGTLIWTLSEIVGAPTIWAYPGMVAPPRLRGRYFGAMQSTYGLGGAIGPFIGVTLFDHLGQRVWLWAAGVALLGALIGRIGMRGRPAEPAGTAPSEPAAAEPAPAEPVAEPAE